MKEVFVESYGEESYGVVFELDDGSYEVCFNSYGGTFSDGTPFPADQLKEAIAYASSWT